MTERTAGRTVHTELSGCETAGEAALVRQSNKSVRSNASQCTLAHSSNTGNVEHDNQNSERATTAMLFIVNVVIPM